MKVKPVKTLIDYTVKDWQMFLGKHKSELNKINQKSGVFTFMQKENMFKIEIKFKNLAVIQTIEVKVKDVGKILFEFMPDKQNKPLILELTEPQRQGHAFVQIVDENVIANSAVITLINPQTPQNSSIFHIIFKGHMLTDKTPKTPKVTNLEQIDNYNPSMKKTVAMHEREIFNSRKKQKTSVQDLVNEVVGLQDAHFDDRELEQAIRKSKQQFRHEQMGGNIGLEEEEYDDGPERYNVVEYGEKMKKVYEHVNERWLKAQLHAEQSLNVKKKHSLENVISMKCMSGLKFCLNIRDNTKSLLQAQIENMGGKIIDMPCSGCYIITKTMEGGKINHAKSIKGVKYVSPQYIHSCSQQKKKLSEDLYSIASI